LNKSLDRSLELNISLDAGRSKLEKNDENIVDNKAKKEEKPEAKKQIKMEENKQNENTKKEVKKNKK
jgi:hypothetical protein